MRDNRRRENAGKDCGEGTARGQLQVRPGTLVCQRSDWLVATRRVL